MNKDNNNKNDNTNNDRNNDSKNCCPDRNLESTTLTRIQLCTVLLKKFLVESHITVGFSAFLSNIGV